MAMQETKNPKISNSRAERSLMQPLLTPHRSMPYNRTARRGGPFD